MGQGRISRAQYGAGAVLFHRKINVLGEFQHCPFPRRKGLFQDNFVQSCPHDDGVVDDQPSILVAPGPSNQFRSVPSRQKGLFRRCPGPAALPKAQRQQDSRAIAPQIAAVEGNLIGKRPWVIPVPRQFSFDDRVPEVVAQHFSRAHLAHGMDHLPRFGRDQIGRGRAGDRKDQDDDRCERQSTVSRACRYSPERPMDRV